MSVAESSCANRSSSIFASSSAIGCSKSRNAVFIGQSRGPLYPKPAAPLVDLSIRPGSDRGCARDTRLRPSARVPRPMRSCASSEATRTGPGNSSGRSRAAAPDRPAAEHQEHFRGPAADSANLDELGDHRFVVHLGPGRDVQAPVDKIAGEPAKILGLAPRSEEHTSELQSRQYLVCRL